jgi:hypothetical protein
MKYLVVLLAVLFGGISVPAIGPATAADLGAMRPAVSHGYVSGLPFPRGPRAAAVWGEGACWRDCQAQCTWGLTGCLSVDSQGRCVKYTDACDRSCQRDCRTRGGPYVDPLFDELD